MPKQNIVTVFHVIDLRLIINNSINPEVITDMNQSDLDDIRLMIYIYIHIYNKCLKTGLQNSNPFEILV